MTNDKGAEHDAMNFDKKAHALKVEISQITDPDNNNDLYLILHKNLRNAHAAGFEAGLKARLPSQKEFEDYFFNGKFKGPVDCYMWIAANMRNEGV